MRNRTLVLILSAVILTSMIFPASVFAADAPPSVKAVFTVSDCTILEGTETADFTLTLANNPGIFAVVGYIGYPQSAPISAFEHGPVFAENEYVLGNPLDLETRHDIVAANHRQIAKIYKEYGVSAEGILATSVYAENNSITINNTNNGILASFSLDTSALTDGEYDITFYMLKNGLCNVDLENIEFELIQGTLTVLGCTHETEKVKTVAPDCVNEGYTEYYCAVCNRTYIRSVTPPLGHVGDEGVVTEPTCDKKGYTTYTCQVCSEVYTDNVTYARGHDFLNEIYREPTCTEDGVYVSVCTVCGFESSDYEDGTALGHELQKETLREATKNKTGLIRTFCTKCDFEEFTETPKLSSGGISSAPPRDDSFKPNDEIFGSAAPAIKDDATEGEKEELKPDETKTENKTENKNYQTGDNITSLIILLTSSALGAGTVAIKRKRENE